MRGDRPPSGECNLCGRSLGRDPTEEGGRTFCCGGCANVHATLGGDGGDADRVGHAGTGEGPGGPGGRAPGAGTVRTFLRIDGMHCATCEEFLESVATSQEGVEGAEASYVTETVRVEYDPDRTSVPDLRDALSTVGYTAVPRDGDGGPAAVGDERGMEDLLAFRYAAGVVFGTFMLLPYVAFLYPVYLSSVFDAGILGLFRDAFGTDGGSGLLVLPLFLVPTSVVLFFTGAPLLRGAYVSLRMRRPNTDLLVTVTLVSAYAYSVAAVLAGRFDVYFDLTIVVAAGVVAATFYESLSKQRAIDRLTDLTVSQVDEASRYRDDGTTEAVPVDDLESGDRVLVRRGERIPVDGVLEANECTVDEAVVTGESLPVLKRAGDGLVGGSLVTDGAAVLRVGVRVTSSIDRLASAVWNLQSANHGVQRRADELASVAIPTVAGVGILAGLATLALGADVPAAVLAFLTALIVACPWALGLATPLSVATSIAEATERGIVVFDETVFERLRGIDVVVFDKTGTLTTGEMDVVEADAPDELLEAAGTLERRASHPAANAIAAAFAGGNGSENGNGDPGPTRADGGAVDDPPGGSTDRVGEFRSHATGVEGTVDGTEILVGHVDLFPERGWSVDDAIETRAARERGAGRLPVVVGRDGTAEGIVVLGDEPREGWEGTVTRLGERGAEVVVLTGDDEAATRVFDRHPHVDRVFAGVPPEGKTATIRRLRSGGHVTMVGDGTNDAPALAAADLGIALGGGTALASDAADVAIVGDDLASVGRAFDLARAARRRVRQNNGLALLYNGITIPLAVGGLLNPLFAMAAVIAGGGLIAANSFRDLLDE